LASSKPHREGLDFELLKSTSHHIILPLHTQDLTRSTRILSGCSTRDSRVSHAQVGPSSILPAESIPLPNQPPNTQYPANALQRVDRVSIVDSPLNQLTNRFRLTLPTDRASGLEIRNPSQHIPTRDNNILREAYPIVVDAPKVFTADLCANEERPHRQSSTHLHKPSSVTTSSGLRSSLRANAYPRPLHS
jgi:hypothetical protein